MSLYSLVFGRNPDSAGLLALLQEVQPFDAGRFRNIWVERAGDTPVIRLHTRNGGGNREYHEDEIASMRAHPWFVRDADDDFDSTYADFYFRPDLTQIDIDTAVALVEAAGDPVDMGEMWMAAIEAIKNAPVPPAGTSEGGG